MKYFIGRPTIRATFNISNISKLAFFTFNDQQHHLNPQSDQYRPCDKVDLF